MKDTVINLCIHCQLEALIHEGKLHEAGQLAEKVEIEEESLDHELEALLKEIEHFTAASAKKAEADEHAAFTGMVTISQASAGVQEVNTNVAQSTEVTESINREITEVSRASSEMTTSSSQVNISAEELAGLAEKINRMVGKFKV